MLTFTGEKQIYGKKLSSPSHCHQNGMKVPQMSVGLTAFWVSPWHCMAGFVWLQRQVLSYLGQVLGRTGGGWGTLLPCLSLPAKHWQGTRSQMHVMSGNLLGGHHSGRTS